MRGQISARDITYLTAICCLYCIYFMGVDYTHIQSFVIDYWPGLMRLYCMFGFVDREIPSCSIVFDATSSPRGHRSASYLLFVQQHALAKNKINIQTLSLETHSL